MFTSSKIILCGIHSIVVVILVQLLFGCDAANKQPSQSANTWILPCVKKDPFIENLADYEVSLNKELDRVSLIYHQDLEKSPLNFVIHGYAELPSKASRLYASSLQILVKKYGYDVEVSISNTNEQRMSYAELIAADALMRPLFWNHAVRANAQEKKLPFSAWLDILLITVRQCPSDSCLPLILGSLTGPPDTFFAFTDPLDENYLSKEQLICKLAFDRLLNARICPNLSLVVALDGIEANLPESLYTYTRIFKSSNIDDLMELIVRMKKQANRVQYLDHSRVSQEMFARIIHRADTSNDARLRNEVSDILHK